MLCSLWWCLNIEIRTSPTRDLCSLQQNGTSKRYIWLCWYIAALHSEGYSQSAIAKRLHISRCAVQNALNHPSGNRKNCKGVKRTSRREDRMIKSIVLRKPDESSETIARQIRRIGICVSSRTIRRRLSTTFNLPARRPAKKPMLTEKQRKMRLRFCHRYKETDEAWWDQVLFTDESTFQH